MPRCCCTTPRPQITLEERVETLHLKATRDPLTNVANRAEFDRVHTEFVEYAPGTRSALCPDHLRHRSLQERQ